MQLSNPIEILNLDDFLPSDGETSLEICYVNRVLNVDIFYHPDGSASRLAKRRIRFSQAKYFLKTPFPGFSFFSCPDDRNLSLLNSLVEYGKSDMLAMEHQKTGLTEYKHYRLFLHSTGVAIHVIAHSCAISNEEFIG